MHYARVCKYLLALRQINPQRKIFDLGNLHMQLLPCDGTPRMEAPVDTISTFLFGPDGWRGLSVFRFTATALSGMILGRHNDHVSVVNIKILPKWTSASSRQS